MQRLSGTLARTGLAGLLALGLVAGAGPAQAVDIKTWHLTDDSGGRPEFFAMAAEEFKKLHPDVNIVYEEFPNEAYKTTMQVALTGSEPPDVFFNWAGADAQRIIDAGLALDITNLGTHKEHLSEAWQSAMMSDDKNYGIPLNAVSKYFYYNKGFFTENNLTPPTTFEGLLQLCRDIRAIDPNIVPWPLGNSERWKLNHVITMLNERVLGQEATAADYDLSAADDQLFTNPGYVEAWQKVLDLQEAGCFQDAPNATSPEASRSMFAAEISPMIYCGTWCGDIFVAEGFNDFAMFRFPGIEGGAGDPGAGFLVPEGFMVSAKTKNPELAAEWASFVVSDEMAAKYAEMTGALPSNPTLIDSVEGSEHFKWFVEDVGKATGGVMVLDVLLEANVANAYLDAGVEILNGTKTPEQAMQDIRAAALAAKAAKG